MEEEVENAKQSVKSEIEELVQKNPQMMAQFNKDFSNEQKKEIQAKSSVEQEQTIETYCMC